MIGCMLESRVAVAAAAHLALGEQLFAHPFHPYTRVLLSAIPQPVPVDGILPDTEVFERGVGAYTLWEFLYWMIVESDNTATNVIIDALGYGAVNAYTLEALGLGDTVLQRKMLDFGAVQAGRNNFTSTADQGRRYGLLYRGDFLPPHRGLLPGRLHLGWSQCRGRQPPKAVHWRPGQNDI